jgi:cytochrome c-type biogenesis protein CcmE
MAMKPRHKRLALIVGGLAALGVATALILSAFQENLVFFFSPSDVVARRRPRPHLPHRRLVEEGSVKREGVMVSFKVTDTAHDINGRYQGILPDLFREGKGVVANGKLGPMACSAPPRCWPSTTRTTCRRRPRTRSSRRRRPARRCRCRPTRRSPASRPATDLRSGRRARDGSIGAMPRRFTEARRPPGMRDGSRQAPLKCLRDVGPLGDTVSQVHQPRLRKAPIDDSRTR